MTFIMFPINKLSGSGFNIQGNFSFTFWIHGVGDSGLTLNQKKCSYFDSEEDCCSTIHQTDSPSDNDPDTLRPEPQRHRDTKQERETAGCHSVNAPTLTDPKNIQFIY